MNTVTVLIWNWILNIAASCLMILEGYKRFVLLTFYKSADNTCKVKIEDIKIYCLTCNFQVPGSCLRCFYQERNWLSYYPFLTLPNLYGFNVVHFTGKRRTWNRLIPEWNKDLMFSGNFWTKLCLEGSTRNFLDLCWNGFSGWRINGNLNVFYWANNVW